VPVRTLALVVALLTIVLLLAAGHTQSLRDVVISEIAWMGTTTSCNGEWIELHNSLVVTLV
jgi:hypothetical protein